MSRSNENNEKHDEEVGMADLDDKKKDDEDGKMGAREGSSSQSSPQIEIVMNGVDIIDQEVVKEMADRKEPETHIQLDGKGEPSHSISHLDEEHTSTEKPKPDNLLLQPPSTAERKKSTHLEEIDRTLDEMQCLADDAFLTTQMAQGHQVKLFDKLFETSSAYLKKCETVPENLSGQQFSDEDGILEEIEEAVRDAEDRLYEPNHVSVMLDTECSSDDDCTIDRYPGLGKLDELRQDGNGLSQRVGGHRVRQRVSSNAMDRRSIISGHERARSNDSRSTSVFSSSIASFRRPISHFSIDNSCFDITDGPTQRSLMCTPIEKMFVKNSRSAPEMRVHETKISPFLPSPSPSNDATTTTSDPSVSSEVSVEPTSPQPAVANLRLRLNEGLNETVSPVSSPIVRPKSRKEKKTNQQQLKGSASSPNMNSQNLIVHTGSADTEIEGESSRLTNNRTFEVVNVRVSNINFVRKPKKPVYIMAKFDGKDVHRSTKLGSEELSHDFSIETTDSFSNLHLVFLEGSKAKVARPVGKVSIAKKELEVETPIEQTFKLCAVSKYQDFCGQICVDIRRQAGVFSLRVVDCGGVKLKENQSLLLLVSEVSGPNNVGKLTIDAEEKRSKEWLEMPCAEGMLSLKLTLWQDLLKGMNSVFHGQVRVDVDENWKSGPAKWFYLRAKTNEDGDGEGVEEIGEVTIKAVYQMDHILNMEHYKPLLELLFASGAVVPLTASLVALIEALPKVELTPISRSLVELLAQTKSIRPVLRSLYVNSILKCQDENTLFRGQSLSGKMLFELLATFGKMYLITTLKPLIDRIYKERKNCEVDPSRILAGVSLEKNTNNLLQYFQMLIDRVTQSSANCPHFIKQLLYDLRTVVGKHSTRKGVQRLAVSSFIIMRFFAAAMMNPKAFEIRKDQPDARMSRTLLLLSKLLQRLSNCSVSDGPLSSKEVWLNAVFETVTSDENKLSMVTFLDNISLVGERSEPERCTVFKFGNLQQVDRSRMAWRKVLQHKKRYVQLTASQLIWQKDVQTSPKGTIALSDIKSVAVDHKNILTIACEGSQVQFEAPGGVEANDWLTAIERQRSRANYEIAESPGDHYFVDSERHVDKIHNLLYKYRDTMVEWRDQLQSDAEFDEKAPELLKASYVDEKDRAAHKESLIATLCSAIDVTDAIQLAHEQYEKENREKVKIEEAPEESCKK